MSTVISSLNQFDFSGKKLLVGCSGGADSIALVCALIDIEIIPVILHVNYGLRGEESDADELFVRSFCEHNQLEILVVSCPKELLIGDGKNLQNEARNFRRSIFNKWTQLSENHLVLLGHHSDDQVETFFLNYFRGSGLWGLSGMESFDNQIVRPFLGLKKLELLKYLSSKNQSYRQDSSNLKNDYLRNLFRNKLIPKLEESVPCLRDSILMIQAEMRKEIKHQQEVLEDFILKNSIYSDISWKVWDSLSQDLQFAFAKKMNWRMTVFNRINELRSLGQGKVLDDSEVFSTKNGFAWSKNSPYKNNWEFKFELIEKLDSSSSAFSLIFSDEMIDRIQIKTATKDLYINKGFKANVFKLLKEKGIPNYWREDYPVVFIDEVLVWVPGISVSKDFVLEKAKAYYKLTWKIKNT